MKKLMKTLAVVLAFALAVEAPVSVSAAGLNLAAIFGAVKIADAENGDGTTDGGTTDGGTTDGGTTDGGTTDGGTTDGGTTDGVDSQVVAVAIKGSKTLNLEKDDIVDLEVNVITNTDKSLNYTVEWNVDGTAVEPFGTALGESCTIKAVEGGQAIVTASVTNESGSVRSDSVVVNVKEYAGGIYFTDFNHEDGESYQYYLKQKIDMSEKLERDTETANDDIFWSVDNNKLATVDKNGVVTMKKLTGTETPVTLTAITETGKVAQAKIYIAEGNPVKKITLVKKTDLVGEQTFTATIESKNGGETTDELVWTSAKTQFVEVVDQEVSEDRSSTTVTLKAVGVGKSKVTVKASTGKSASMTVNAQVKLEDLEIVDERGNTEEGTTYPLKKVTLKLNRITGDKNYVNKDKIVWESSDKKIATVSGKKDDTAVVTVKKKTFTQDELDQIITIKATSKADSSVFAVYSLKITRSDLAASDLGNITGAAELLVGEEADYKATIKGGEADDEITWTSSSAKVLTIDQEGHAVALKSGKATVKATITLANGKTASKSFKVKVTQPTTTLTMKKSLVTVVEKKKKSVAFTAVKAPKGAAGTIKYRVSDSDVEAVPEQNLAKNKVVIPANATVAGDVITVEASVGDVTTEGQIVVVAGTPKINVGAATKNKLTLTQGGDPVDLKVSLQPEIPGFEDEFTYTLNKKGIVSVDKDGYVTALLPGTAKITIKSTTGAKATVTVKVNAGQVGGSGTTDGGDTTDGKDKK